MRRRALFSAAALCAANAASRDASTIAVGRPRATSSAKLGPESAPTFVARGSSSATTWCGSSPLAVSNPLQAQTTGAGDAHAAIARSVSRNPEVAVATRTASHPPTARARSGSIATVAGMETSGR